MEIACVLEGKSKRERVREPWGEGDKLAVSKHCQLFINEFGIQVNWVPNLLHDLLHDHWKMLPSGPIPGSKGLQDAVGCSMYVLIWT